MGKSSVKKPVADAWSRIAAAPVLLGALPVSERGVGGVVMNHLLLLLGPAQLWQEMIELN